MSSRVLAAAVAAIVAAGAIVSVVALREDGYEVRASFAAAVGLVEGLEVQLGGRKVGEVKEVAHEDGRASVVMRLHDGPAVPLRRGTRVALRFGTTIGSATRRIDVAPGPLRAPAIPDGGVLPAADARAPVEWDEVFTTFDRDGRSAARAAARTAANVLDGREAELDEGLAATPAGTDALAGVIDDLASDRAMLARLFPATARVTRTLARRRDSIRALILVAGETFATFARRSRELRGTIAALPDALAQTTTTLRRLDATAARLRPLLRDLRPGTRELRTLGGALTPALAALRRATPAGLRASSAAERATAPLRRLLRTLGPFLADDAAPVLADLAPMLRCVVPYSPELTGWLSNWESWNRSSDGAGHYGRYHIIDGSQTFATLTDVPGAARLPGVRYARALAPGAAAGKPRALPECGYTSALREPAADPEGGR